MAGGRPRGSKAQGLEPCPRHPGSRVVRNGRYGSSDHRRQLYKCFPEDGSSPHSFAGAAPRREAQASSCEHCENPVEEHQGPRHARHYGFPVSRAADALVMVGQGVSYTEAADRARVRDRRDRVGAGAALVANWVEALGPVVVQPRAEREWPETVVLDDTWFDVTNRRTGDRSRAFHILGVYGYPAGEAMGRVWALHATPQARQSDWKRLLDTLPGDPVLAICDDDDAVRNAISQRWPDAFIKLCEHHLRARALHHSLKRTKTYRHPTMELLNDAFKTPQGWRDYKQAAAGRALHDWIAANDAKITDQVARRATLPAHHSTGALDEALAKVREFVEPRAFCYRNAERTNRMLALVRLRLNRADDPLAYAASIRDHLDEHGGVLPPQGSIRDRRGQYSLRS